MRKRSATLFAFCLYLTLTAHGVASVSEEDVAPEKIERKKHPTPVGCTVTKDPNFNIVSDTLNESTSNGAFSDTNANFSIGTGFSAVTPEQDARYMELASKESRTAEEDAELRKMVDDAASANGYTLKVFHGTDNEKFRVFHFGRAGIFTTPDLDIAETFGKNIFDLYANTNGKQLIVDAHDSFHSYIPNEYIDLDLSEYRYFNEKGYLDTNELCGLAFRAFGYDSVVIKNVSDDSSLFDNTGNLTTDIVFKDSSQVKSADLVTYSEDGKNIVRLSDRFRSDREGLDAWKNGDINYSIGSGITDINTDKVYNNVVILDTDIFDDVSPRKWNKALHDWIIDRINKQGTVIVPVVDENGEVKNVEFARPEDSIRSNGNNRRVINELTHTNDNISKLSTAHIDEVAEVWDKSNPYFSKRDESDNHGWLDRNGWLHRTAIVANSRNGRLYEVTFDIAKAEDGRLIYYSDKGKIKTVGQANVGSMLSQRPKAKSQLNNSKSQYPDSVNGASFMSETLGDGNYSLSAPPSGLTRDRRTKMYKWRGESLDSIRQKEYEKGIGRQIGDTADTLARTRKENDKQREKDRKAFERTMAATLASNQKEADKMLRYSQGKTLRQAKEAGKLR